MTPYAADSDFTLYVGDVRDVLRELPDGSVDCVITSPPYWGLRDYGVDGQLGLEPTPDEYVHNMVAVFREIRRVLAAHGTCWVNLGDSYASTPPGKVDDPFKTSGLAGIGGANYRADRTRLRERNMDKVKASGLKPKDLVGIPWKVAQALQAPYYVGRLQNEVDRAWLAGFLDGEGTVSYVERNRGPDHSPTHDIRVFITNTNDAVLSHFRDLFDAGRVYQHDGERENRYGSRACYRWQMGTHDSALLLRELYPYLRAKHKQTVLVWTLYTTLRHKNGHARTPADVLERRRALADLIRRLNRGEDVDVPSWCEAPPSPTEPGWYLRSDIIWAKPNPMPESVTDRPTKAHEYVFMLSKQPRYWFDSEAVREKYERGDNTYGFRGGGPNSKNAASYLNQNGPQNNSARGPDGRRNTRVVGQDGSMQHRDGERWPNGGRNVRSVWEIATQPYPEAHFATYPEELVRRCLLAGCPLEVCRVCGKPRERIVRVDETLAESRRGTDAYQSGGAARGATWAGSTPGVRKSTETVGWSDCGHNNNWRPGVVLDPFLGSGTTAKVARDHGRKCVGIELNETYAALILERTKQLSLLADGTA